MGGRDKWPVTYISFELILTARFYYMAAWDIGRNAGFRLASSDPGVVYVAPAVPDAGFRFVSWTGACTGVGPTCVVQVFGRTQAQANFAK